MDSADDAPRCWARAADAGLTFRTVDKPDEPFLFALYASTRTEELARLPWSDAQKRAFLDMQARAQHTDYQRRYSNADWLIIEHEGADIGRLYLIRQHRTHHLIDVALLPEWRGKGLGEALLRDLHDEAATSAKALSITVEKFNPAMRLYQRLGFRKVEDYGIYDLMEWQGPASGDEDCP